MPLRDHFRPPTSKFAGWQGFHATWPVVMLQHLRGVLPKGYVAEPRVHLGTYFEIDIGAFELYDTHPASADRGDSGGGVATLPWAPPEASLALETELPEF
ncbi:MAG: hypothetical protein ACRCZF_04875, partial [Gemmataceae bacterium]